MGRKHLSVQQATCKSFTLYTYVAYNLKMNQAQLPRADETRRAQTTLRLALSLWAQWVIATSLAGLVGCALILVGVVDFEWGLCLPSTLGGVLLGVAQGYVLWNYLKGLTWITWTLWSGFTWLPAMIIFFIGDVIAGIGGGLNDTDTTDVFIGACCLSGFVYAALQRTPPPILREPWILVNAFAWAVGGFVGVAFGKWVYHAITPTIYVELDKPWGFESVAAGSFVATLVYAVITGAGIVHLLRNIGYKNQEGPTIM